MRFGHHAVTVNHATYDPALDIRGDMTIAANAVWTKRDLAGTAITFKKGATQTLTDNTSGTGQDLGAVQISVNSTNTIGSTRAPDYRGERKRYFR